MNKKSKLTQIRLQKSNPWFDGILMLIQDAKLRAAVLCIQNGLMTINDFAKDFRKKIRSYLADSSLFVIDDEIENNFSTCILNYVRDLSIQFTDYQLMKR